MNCIPFAEIGADAWDAFCAASPDAWLRHTSTFISFALTLSQDPKDLSFAITDNDAKIVALMPLVSQTIGTNERHEFAMGGTPIPFPAFARGVTATERADALMHSMEELDRLAQMHGVAYARMFLDPLSEPLLSGEVKTSPLLDLGFSDTSIRTTTVDLSYAEELLLSRMADRRRRYISAAARTQKYKVDFFDATNTSEAVWSSYKDIYFRAAGRVVGTPARWEAMYEWLRSGTAILALIRTSEGDSYIAGHLVMTYRGRAYDGISAILPDHMNDHDLGVVMQWETVRYLKRGGYSRYEIGWLFPTTISEAVYSKKELAISHFKELFGGDIFPLFRGEKYYDSEYANERQAALRKAYAAQYGPSGEPIL